MREALISQRKTKAWYRSTMSSAVTKHASVSNDEKNGLKLTEKYGLCYSLSAQIDFKNSKYKRKAFDKARTIHQPPEIQLEKFFLWICNHEWCWTCRGRGSTQNDLDGWPWQLVRTLGDDRSKNAADCQANAKSVVFGLISPLIFDLLLPAIVTTFSAMMEADTDIGEMLPLECVDQALSQILGMDLTASQYELINDVCQGMSVCYLAAWPSRSSSKGASTCVLMTSLSYARNCFHWRHTGEDSALPYKVHIMTCSLRSLNPWLDCDVLSSIVSGTVGFSSIGKQVEAKLYARG